MIKSNLLLLFFTLFIFALFPSVVYGSYEYVGISESFDSDLSGWKEVFDPQSANCPNSWQISDGRLKATVPYPCTTNLLPIDSVWNDFGNEYAIEMDIWFINGKDHNIVLRYLEGDFENDIKSRFTEFHFVVSGTNPVSTKIHLDGVRYGPLQNFSYITPNKPDPYHINIFFRIGHIELFIDDVLVAKHNYPPELDNFPSGGKFALRAGSGQGQSETHFDNVRVYKIIDDIDVPYLSQLDPEWKDFNYGYSGLNIGYLGCSLTSSAMLLRSLGINTIPETSDAVTPLSLNYWLLNNNGYDHESNLIFPKLAKLSTEYVSLNPSAFASSSMELKRVDLPVQDMYDYTNNSITNLKNPVIIKKNSPISPSNNHFIVGRGVLEEDSKYLVHDPLDEAISISNIPPDQYHSAISLVPSNSDLSYLVLHTDEAVRFVVQDPNGFENEDVERSIYGLIEPFTSYLEPDGPSMPTTREFEQKYPLSGEYSVQLEVDEDGFYDIWLLSMDKEGNDYLYKESLFLKANSPSSLTLVNDHDDSENTSVEFVRGYRLGCGEMSGMIDHLYQNGHIKHKGVHRMFKYYAKRCLWKQKRYAKFAWIIKKYVVKRVERLHPRFIDDYARELLLEMVRD